MNSNRAIWVGMVMAFALICLWLLLKSVPVGRLQNSVTEARAQLHTAAIEAQYPYHAYDIRLEGQDHIQPEKTVAIPFNGSCLVTSNDGSSESKSIDGVTPRALSYVGERISCSYQKQDKFLDRLRVVVRRDGTIVKTIDTESAYGIVSFTI